MPPRFLGNRLRHGSLAGLAGGAAFSVVMEVDQRLTGFPANDYRMLADFGPFARWWPVLGRLAHATNSVAVGASYAMVEDHLRGPGWLRGLTFAMIENVILWPAIIVIDRVHPATRAGELPRYNRPLPAILEIVRHVAYGVVLGAVYERFAARSCPSAQARPSRMAMFRSTFSSA